MSYDISDRAKAMGPKTPSYFLFLRKLMIENPRAFYHKEKNPDGIMILTIAENNLSLDMIVKKIGESGKTIPYDICGYGNNTYFRQDIANLFERKFFKGRKLDANNFVIGNGAGSVVNMLAYTICNPGEGVIIPSPYYPGFDLELGLISEAVAIPAFLQSSNNFKFDISILQQALDKATAENVKVKAVLISSPNNPTGAIYTKDELIQLYEWTKANKIHFIVDEIYALSCYNDNTSFVSISDVLSELGEPFGDNVHVVWSFSKDFTLSGFRVGVLYSENQAIIDALAIKGFFFLASNYTQFVLHEVLTDTAFVDQFLDYNQKNLHQSYQTITSCLNAHSIPYVEGGSGFFVLINLRKYLQGNDWEAEDKLWQFLALECKVFFTPGKSMHCHEPGWFRCCFATFGAQEVEAKLIKMANILNEKFGKQ